MKRLKISMALGAVALGLASFVATHAATLRFSTLYYFFKTTPSLVYDGHLTFTPSEKTLTGCDGPSTKTLCRKGYTANQINFPAVTLKANQIAKTIIYTNVL